jgi:PAS domain S-box-containing protein
LQILFTTLEIKNLMSIYHQAHMTSLFENATEGIILTNGSGSIMMINPAAEKMFGYDKDELLGHPVEILVPQNTKPHHHELRDNFYHKPSNRAMGYGRDLYAIKKDGNNLPVEISLSHYKQDGEMFVIAFIVDITHRKEIEKNMLKQKEELEKITGEMRKLNTELETKVEERTLILKEALQKLEQSQTELSEALSKEKQLNEIKSRFVSMASHEFRTPLTTVLSSASLIAKYTTTDEQEKRDKHIRRIKNSVENLNDVLEDFLSLGKLNDGKVEAKCEPIDIKHIIEDTADEIKPLLKQGQYITINYIGNSKGNTDKKLLRNILINLISNATKFSNEGKEIKISGHVENGVACITVADNGIGIAKEDQVHLFSTFFRGANAINIQGTGLGLHIVKRYADLLGGNIELESTLNIGTKIILYIPIK